ncbi:MAG TPA: 2-amino-4-hydroxy-6-hydroxymethyldihydropteridine diphosphokinase [Deltaproteobacteria bacterium]|nr:2-amino-4-hydroxy-6-hydroxymethyldihydropteridine diphosphokinase [Deltaproteobacteria bacterium]
MMVRAFIGLGSNLGDGLTNLQTAWQRLGEVPGVRLLRLSSPYLTEPVGMVSSHWFTNGVGELATELGPHELLAAMLGIEAAMGRDRAMTKDRPVDLDLLYFGDEIIRTADLIVPHPEMARRMFVMAPLAELAPDSVHPLLKMTAAEICAQLSPAEKIEKTAWRS